MQQQSTAARSADHSYWFAEAFVATGTLAALLGGMLGLAAAFGVHGINPFGAIALGLVGITLRRTQGGGS